MLETLLIVDDDSHMRFVIKELLPRKFPIILQADSVSQARKICDNIKIDLVICDFNLLDGSGSDVYNHLVKKQKNTIFLMFTGGHDLIEIPQPQNNKVEIIYGKDIFRLRSLIAEL